MRRIGGSKVETESFLKGSFRNSGGDYGGLEQVEAVEAASSGPLQNLLKMELTKFADGSDVR